MDFAVLYPLLALLVFYIDFAVSRTGLAHFKMSKIGPCDPSTDYPLAFAVDLRTDGNQQYLSGKGDFKVDFGVNSDFNMTITIKKSKDEGEFSPLINLHEDDTCTGLKKYLGDFYEEMEKSAGIEAGKCPVEKGSYTLKEYPLDFKKLAYQSIPEGVIRCVQTITHKETKEVLSCMIGEGENFP